jgi:predicted ATPase/DNA-binding SARP family transcriptional activator
MQVGVLGPLEVRNGAGAIEISGARLRLLLTVLALDAPRAVPAGALVDALWNDEPPTDQANALQSLVSRLRKALGNAELVQQSAAGYRLAVDETDIDLHRFDALVREAKDVRRSGNPQRAADLLVDALELWRGAPVEALDSHHAPALLARLDEQHLDARADLIDARLALGQATEVVAELEGLVAAYPMRERYAALLVRALTDTGRQAEALSSYERARATLADELGADPSAELKEAHLRALANDPGAATTGPQTNLRAALTSFVGRDEQLATIGKLLGEGRLVTLVGPGGAGKTRLATESAATFATDCAVWLAELAPVTDPGDVAQTVLGSLGVRDAVLIERPTAMTTRDAMSRLIDALSDRDAVIVVDNCEHVIDAAAELVDQLLARCAGLRILATSREPLGIFGESLVVVPPLGQPAADADAADAITFPAIQLFADRAQDVAPGFAIDNATVGPVIEIVRRLDGQPLAIELAAARLRTLPVDEIARRLSDRFRLLTGGSRTAMPRHRTLRAVVEWSWDLLTEPERLLSERLAVFTGGVTSVAAAIVCGGADLVVDDIDDLLASLVDKSLLQTTAVTGAEQRYRMLETIREFGLERMAERGEVGTIRRAHAVHFAGLVAEADSHVRRPEQLPWMALLAVERDNILAALKFFGDNGEAQQAVELVNLLGWYWMTIGSHGEIVTWATFALETPGEVETTERLMAEAFVAMNAIGWEAGGTHEDVDAAMRQLHEVSDRVSRLTDDVPLTLVLLAPIIAMFSGNDEQVGPLMDRALACEDTWVTAAVRTFRAALAENSGDATTMREDAETALASFRAIGERWGIANSLQLLGQVELMEGNLSAAAAAYREGLDLAEAIGSREDIAIMRLRLGDILTRLGDTSGAGAQAELAMLASLQSGSPIEMMLTHVMQAELARASGEDLEQARELLDAAAERLRRLPSVHPIHSHGMAILLTTAAKIDLEAGSIDAARTALTEAYTSALETKDMPIVANTGVATAMVSAELGDTEGAAEILGAAAQLRGADDFTQFDIAALVNALDVRGDGAGAKSYARGRALSRADALARVNPASL